MARPQRLRRLALLAAMVTALAAAAVAIAIFSSNSTEAAAGSAQNPITILSPWEGSEERAFARRLFAGKLRFDHASVIAALRRMTTILDDPYVAGGIRGALETNLGDGITLVFGQKPRAHLYMEGGFVGGLALQYIRPKPKPGTTIDPAPFPTIDPRFGSPLVGGTNLAAAFVDNDGVRELLLYLSSPAAGNVWVSSGAVVSPNKRVPSSAYPNVLVRKEAKQVARASLRLRRLRSAARVARRGMGRDAPGGDPELRGHPRDRAGLSAHGGARLQEVAHSARDPAGRMTW